MKTKFKIIGALAAISCVSLAGGLFAACFEDNPNNNNNNNNNNNKPTVCEHMVDDWTEITPATCEEEGEKVGICTKCEEEITETIPALGGVHDYAIYNPGFKAATCEEEGTRTLKCTICLDELVLPLPVLGHEWVYDEVISEASCTVEGKGHRHCTRTGCEHGKEEEYVIEAPGHLWSTGTSGYVVEEIPTLQKAGTKARYCTVCGEINPEGKITIPQLDASKRIGYELRLTRSTGNNTNLSDVTYTVFDQNGQQAATGKFTNGQVTPTLFPGQTYTVKLSGLPNGYSAKDSYTLDFSKFAGSGNALCEIELSAEVIKSEPAAGMTYSVGSVMHDFTYTTIDYQTITLSKLLETKKLVVLNFFFTSCYWCRYEMPEVERVYQDYKDDMAVIAIDISGSDTVADINQFKKNLGGLSFYFVQDLYGDRNLTFKFNVDSAPFSVFIDQQGVICRTLGGYVGSENDDRNEQEWRKIVAGFVGEKTEKLSISSSEVALPAKREN